MTQPQDQPNTRGQCLNYNRAGKDYGTWAGVIQKSTLTLSVFALGDYSFKINGVLVEYEAVGGDDANTTIAGLLADFQGKSAAQRAAAAFSLAASPTVLRLEGRNTDDSYTITEVTGTGTFTFADATTQRGRLDLGLAVAFVDDEPETLRELGSGDAGGVIVGVTIEAFEVAPSSGDPADEDGYDPGTSVTYVRSGLVPVPVETEITSVNDPVYARIIAPGDEEVGAFRNDDDGGSGDVVVVPNARWTLLSWTDNQSRQTAEIRVNLV